MPVTTTLKPKTGIDPTVAIVAYVVGAFGLILVLGITFCILRRIRWRRARKYIKQQGKKSIGMGPVLDSEKPRGPWRWKEVKANIKAKHKGEEPPYPHKKPEPTVSTISNGNHSTVDTSSIHGVTRPLSANGNGTTSLGPSHKKMHGERQRGVARHVKHDRLQIRIEAKRQKREMKARQKEIKKDLTLILEGQRLPGDEFPDTSSAGTSYSPVTHVGPLRRESLMEIPNTTLLIHRSTGAKQLDLPQNLCTWDEEGRGSSSNLSARGGMRSQGPSPRHMKIEATVHHVSDRRGAQQDSDLESVTSDDNTTEL